jgi:RNA polymerase sigma-70 factor (ECF subfamily)
MPKHMDNELWDEKRLVSLLKEGDEQAFRVLMGQYKNKIYGIAFGITLDREESYDIVQEVMAKVYEKIHAFKGESTLCTWLHRITVNQCLNWKRTWKRRFRWRHQSLDVDEGGERMEFGTNEYLPETQFRRKELEKKLWQSLGELPSEARTVFVLKELEGLSYDEIARMLKNKKGTVSSRLHHARKRLRDSLRPYLEEEKTP